MSNERCIIALHCQISSWTSLDVSQEQGVEWMWNVKLSWIKWNHIRNERSNERKFQTSCLQLLESESKPSKCARSPTSFSFSRLKQLRVSSFWLIYPMSFLNLHEGYWSWSWDASRANAKRLNEHGQL